MQTGERHREGPGRESKKVTERNAFSPPTLSKLGVTKNNPPNGNRLLTFQTKTTRCAPVLPCGHMATTCTPGTGLRRAEFLREIQTRLALTEEHVERLRTRWLALPENHPGRRDLLRQIEISAAVAAELLDLLSLITGREVDTEPGAASLAQPRCRPRE
jgi:hypothetical protein